MPVTMGLCPDCKSEGETVSYVGASRADLIDGIEPDDECAKDDVEESDDVEICDLCEVKFFPEG